MFLHSKIQWIEQIFEKKVKVKFYWQIFFIIRSTSRSREAEMEKKF